MSKTDANRGVLDVYEDVDASNLNEMMMIDEEILALRNRQQQLGEHMGYSMLKCPIEKLETFIQTFPNPENSWPFDIATRIYSLRKQAETESQAEVLSEVIAENFERKGAAS